ncbi:MAG: SpvB/TcaC N-terminal domain-containing protein, partial [Bradymonadaceae bacterium]
MIALPAESRSEKSGALPPPQPDITLPDPEDDDRPELIDPIPPHTVPPKLPMEPGEGLGALPGRFFVNDVGGANYEIPLELPPARNGVAPTISVTYDSTAGDGHLGFGWGLSGFSVIDGCPKTRGLDNEIRPVQMNGQDVFCLDGNRLVAIDGAYGADGTQGKVLGGPDGAGPDRPLGRLVRERQKRGLPRFMAGPRYHRMSVPSCPDRPVHPRSDLPNCSVDVFR